MKGESCSLIEHALQFNTEPAPGIKMKKYTTVLSVALFLAAGCVKDRFERQQEIGGLVTASALVAALPLIPVGMGYQAYLLTHGNKKEKLLREQLDPVYQKRTEMIKARSPRADAYQSWTNGAVAFLGGFRSANLVVNLDPAEPCLKNLEGNRERIEHDELLKYLATLMSDDSLHQQANDVEYFSETYKQFLHAGWAYQDIFNHEMCRLVQKSEPAPWPRK